MTATWRNGRWRKGIFSTLEIILWCKCCATANIQKVRIEKKKKKKKTGFVFLPDRNKSASREELTVGLLFRKKGGW